MNEKSSGIIIILVTIFFMVFYFLWAFAPFLGPIKSVISPSLSEWAFRIPVLLAVYLLFLIILWIGYTMATTPPPVPIENPLELIREKKTHRFNHNENQERENEEK